MDQIAAILVAAIAERTTPSSKSTVSDSYDGLKALIQRKYEGMELPAAMGRLEEMPESKNRLGMVQEGIEMSGADKDAELIEAVQALAEALKGARRGKKESGKSMLNFKACNIGVVGDNADIRGGIHFGKNER